MNEQDIFEVRQTDVEIQEIFDQVPKNTKAIEDINGKLPAEASPENPLADKEYVDGKVGDEANARQEAVNAERTRAEGAEQTLQGGISSEAQARQQADQMLDGKIAGNTQAITAIQEAIKAFVNSEQVQTLINTALQPYSTTTEMNAAISAAITSALTAYYTKTATDELLSNKVDKVSGKQLSTEDFTTALKTKLDALPTAADLSTQISTAISTALEAYYNKTQVDNLLAPKQTAEQVSSAIAAALTSYSTTTQMNAAIESALASYYTKTEIDAALAAINTAIGQKASQADLTAEVNRAKAAEQANATNIAGNAEEIAKLKAIVADIETIAEGYIRVAGSSSPALSYKSYKYHEQGGFGRESVFSLFYPCLVGTKLTGDDAQVGTILFVLKKLGARLATAEDTAFTEGQAVWEDINGNLHAIDGSEGDVMICNIEPYYSIDGKHTIDGTEYDVFLKSRTPFTWQGIEAVMIDKMGMSPDYCVSHQDEDGVIRMHSAYNLAWNGSYSAPVGVAGKYVYTTDPETGDIVETYDADATLLGGAGGLHTTDIDLPTGEQRAMNMNPDTTKTVPFMNQTAEACNRMQALLLSEGGTFDAHNANLMGSGFSSNDPATAAGDWEQSGSGAKNGLRVMDKNGAWKYYPLSGNVSFLTGATTGTVYAANVINSWRNPWHVMEAHRAVSYAIKNDVHELEWFVFEGNKYKYRSVSGFNGPSHGEMTCVVWKIMATQAGAAAIDPTDNATSIAGNRVEILVSTALIHGVTTQVSPSWWVSGLIFTEDEHGQYECYIERDQHALLKSPTGDYAADQVIPFEEHYEHLVTIQKGDGYARNYHNDALMMPDTNANKTGAGLHTYVGKYNWFVGGNAPAGKRGVRGFRRGSGAYVSHLSPLALVAIYSPSFADSGFGFGTCCSLR